MQDDPQHIVRALETVLKELVTDPGALTVTLDDSGPAAFVLRVSVPPSDVGRLVGRQGRTARSLRIILTAISTNYGKRMTLDIRGETKDPTGVSTEP